MPLTHHYTVVDGVNIHYVESGNHAAQKPIETLVFLHGFPEYWGTWLKQLDFFACNYRVIAPDLPGYNLSDKPTDTGFYTVPNLIRFMSKFIAAVSPNQPVTLIAHDWGGAIAWPLAAFNASLLSRLVILNAAHPSTFTREMINNSNQRSKSAYIHQLIEPEAESLLTQDDYHYLVDKIMQSQQPAIFTHEVLDAYRQVWRQPGAINGMLQYYRAMPQLARNDAKMDTNDDITVSSNSQVKHTSALKIPNIRINLPTLVLWGEQDLAFVNENLDDLIQYVPNCTIKRFAHTSHWIQHERPNEVNNAISDFLTSKK
ncbi:alpha/beta fold hydrolase [Shewanella ulleungensis]|uniref:Alpha/beta hydrolase n=1 Tax=Shewanella ulleungensis TaxID=2282699 RepID=A0ABQ2QEI2_9GAMM|nr:alpha/beta hydrolase [Shewanella ulleungensis]MCL1148799.1 alpha/beta hydrolase [Shewanella ulleungensis]GGP75549.1 alpha/beta hydrolase [Shewanella ulleungensis]